MMRIKKGLSACLLLTLFLVSGWAVGQGQGFERMMAATNLRCEYLNNPLGIDVREPRFSWVLTHGDRGERQNAYQVLVASRPQLLDRDQGDQWDSGKVVSRESIQVAYVGKALESGRAYYWKVRWWDSQGRASAYSQSAQFEVGILGREEWKGRWITGGGLLRKDFVLDGKVVRARAYITALGYYELRINGRKVGDNVLDPAYTTYPKRVLYSTYDVTSCLEEGKNAVGVMFGGGWATLQNPNYKAYHSSPAVLLQMNIELAGGKRVSMASEGSWKAAPGPIVSNSIYDGEVYDARKELAGWDRPGFDASAWKTAETVEGSNGALSAEMMPPIRVVETIVPLVMTNPQPGVYVYDMGQNFAGWAQLRVRGPRGTTVKLRFAETVYPNGMANQENLRIKAREIYILRGEGVEVYEPRFTYHGFRYVEVTGFPGTRSVDTVRGRVVHTAVETVGSFAASNPILGEIQRIIRWTQLNNLYSIPTDCPQRGERQGWMGDASLTAQEAMLNFDMAAFYTNFLRDIHDVQGDDGTITDTVPHRYGSRPADPAWGTAYPLICWAMWQQYGDRRVLEEHYQGLKKYVDFLGTLAQDHILRYSHYGDWVATAPTPGEYVSAAYYYDDVHMLAEIAKALGKSADADSYAQLADQIRDAFNRQFFNSSTGEYANGTQTALAMAIEMGLVPQKQQALVSSRLTNNIVYEHDTHLTTGIHGTKFLMLALTKIGRSDLAYELATQTTYPSWGYMLSHGATTVWELWQDKNGPGMNSHDHPAFGSVGAWLYQALAGINVDAEGEGYRHIAFRPQIVRDLAWASASLDTIRGTVSTRWTHSAGTITVEVEVPVTSDATVLVPKEPAATNLLVRESDRIVWEGGKYVAGGAGVSGAREEAKGIIFSVGSGHYSFKLTGE